MRIDFECSGGFANLRLAYHADTAELPPELADELLSLVLNSGVFELKQSEVEPKPKGGPPDVFFYRLTLSEGGKTKSLLFNDVTAPMSLHPLLALLRKLALDQRQKGV